MPRTLNDFQMQSVFPPVGKYQVSIISVEKGKSATKQTPQITLTFDDGENIYSDNLFVTPKTIPRLALVAKRVCLMDEKTVLPDDDMEAANIIAKFIMQNALHKQCIVKIEENEESFIPTSGPDVGKTKTIKKRRVAYNGYERFTGEPLPQSTTTPQQDDMPF